VRRIVTANGRASGVELEDGRRIEARRFVCSGIPAPVTLGALVDEGQVPRDVAFSLERYRWQADSIFAVHLALREPPRYQGDAALSEGLNVCVGIESSDAWEAQHRAVLDGAIPDIGMECAVPSLFDPQAAPDGQAVAFAWQLVPREPADGGAARWNGPGADALATLMIERWRVYAPNLADAEIARAVHHPLDLARAVPSFVLGDRHHGSYHPDNFDEHRPHPSLSGYRTPVDALYLCGSSSYPGGSLTGQPGYNAAGVIAEDCGLPRWWNPAAARDALARLA
jgi:phytoene dehydrogenase-like protein